MGAPQALIVKPVFSIMTWQKQRNLATCQNLAPYKGLIDWNKKIILVEALWYHKCVVFI